VFDAHVSSLSLLQHPTNPQANCGTGGTGTTMSLVALPNGQVVVGLVPIPTLSTTTTGTIAEPGCLVVLNSKGGIVQTIGGGTTLVNGPWGATLGLSSDGKTAYMCVPQLAEHAQHGHCAWAACEGE
jgi:hypothetical protein